MRIWRHAPGAFIRLERIPERVVPFCNSIGDIHHQEIQKYDEDEQRARQPALLRVPPIGIYDPPQVAKKGPVELLHDDQKYARQEPVGKGKWSSAPRGSVVQCADGRAHTKAPDPAPCFFFCWVRAL